MFFAPFNVEAGNQTTVKLYITEEQATETPINKENTKQQSEQQAFVINTELPAVSKGESVAPKTADLKKTTGLIIIAASAMIIGVLLPKKKIKKRIHY